MMTALPRLLSVERRLVAMPVVLIAGLIILAATGCVESKARFTPTPEPTAVPTATTVLTVAPTATPVPPSPTPVPTATAVPPTPTPTPSPTAVPTVVPTAVLSTDAFNLTLDPEGIVDGATIYGETVVVRGITSVDAIVSVNDVILEVQPDGSFELTVLLDEGPNVIDVVASNLTGSSINYSLVVVSIPPTEEDSP